MLETLAIVLIVLWILGLVSSYTMGGLIHILLFIALVALLFRLLRGQKQKAPHGAGLGAPDNSIDRLSRTWLAGRKGWFNQLAPFSGPFVG
jgi:hypothetical protein